MLVVLGHRSEEIAAALDGEGAEVVLNPRYREGMLTSIQAGVAAAPAETEWLLIALGDQPSLRTALVDHLIGVAREVGGGLVVPSYGRRRGHPLLIHAGFRDEIAALDPDVGLRELMLRHADAIRYVPAPDESVLADMDTPEEYARELKRLADAGGTG